MLGRSDIATVYLATDAMLDRRVAVKVLHPHLCREGPFVEQFLEMERRLARLFHPHVVTIYDADATDETCFVVMEYVSGGTLRTALAKGKALPVGETIRLISQVADGLHALHSEGVIHGDVKPENVLLDESGNAKLADFGITYLASATQTIEVEELAETVPYLAPEQLEEGRADARSDIYALGVLTYELLAGRKPFEGESWATLATQPIARQPTPLSISKPDVSPDIERVITRALARDPAERQETVAAFRRALHQAHERPAAAAASSKPWIVERVAGVRPPSVRIPRLPRDGIRNLVARIPRPRPPRVSIRNLVARIPRPRPPRVSIRDLAARIPRPRPPRVGIRDLARRFRGQHPAMQILLASAAVTAVLAVALILPGVIDPPKTAAVPDLTGQPIDAARSAARQVSLSLEAVDEPSNQVPRGVIVRQEPPAGAALRSDRPMRVVVSSGLPPVRMGDLNLRRLDDARNDLVAAGLTPGKVEERETPRQPWGTVIGQSVPAGRLVEHGSSVDLTVGVPPWTNVPRLTDRTIGEAEAELERRGLRLGGVRNEPAVGKRAGTVLAQEPAGELRIRQGEAVSVAIAVPPWPTAAP